MCWPKNLLKTWAKFKPVTRHHSWQRGISDFDMYILPLLYLHQKMIRIYADIVQNHTLPGVYPNFWRAMYHMRYMFKMLLNCSNTTWSHFVYVYIVLQIKYVPHDFWNSRVPLPYPRQVVSLFALICHKILMDRWERKKTFYLCGLIKSFALITPSCLPRR